MTHFAAPVALALALVACSSAPPAPDWQVDASGALARFQQAYLEGNARVAEAEFSRARRALEATGQPGLVARAELTRCAMQVASLVFEHCSGLDRVRPDLPAAENAYEQMLQARLPVKDATLLPARYRAVAQGEASSLAQVADPTSRLIAAGVLVRAGRGSPTVLQVAVDTASAQGWRRPLLAWLGAQLLLAQQQGDGAAADRLRRRIALVSGGP